MTEDLTTYTEVDPNGRISKTASRVTLSYLTCVEDAYLYKDFGASYFDKIDLKFDGMISSTSGYSGECIAGFSNLVDDANGWSSYHIKVCFYRNSSSGTYWVYILTATDYQAYQISANTTYYLTLTRDAGSNSATLKIYSDSARTTLLQSLSVTGVGATSKFRYFFPAVSANTGESTSYFYGYYENFLLGGSPLGQVRVIGMMM